MLRTTTAVTVISGGNKENVLPESAEALVNFRLLPGDTVGDVVAHVREASAMSPFESRAAAIASGLAGRIHPLGGVSNHRAHRARAVSRRGGGAWADDRSDRFEAHGAARRRRVPVLPVRARPEDLARFHGTDERISIANYVQMIAFYRTLIEHAAGAR